MLSPSDLALYQGANDNLNLLIAKDMTDVVDYARGQTRQQITQLVKAAAPEVVLKYSDTAATLAADMYERARAAEGVRGSFTAQLADPVPVAALEGSAGNAVKSIWKPEMDLITLLGLLVGSAKRHVLNAGRWTTMRNAERDGGGWYRQPKLGACPFCLMLASRGAVYGSQETASVTGHAGRQRGARGNGKQYHDSCGCVAVRAGKDGVPQDIQNLQDTWYEVTKGTSGQGMRDAWNKALATNSPAA